MNDYCDHEVRFIDAIRQYIGSRYIDRHDISVSAETSFSELNFDLIDEVAVRDMILSVFEIPTLMIDSWPDTIGELLSAARASRDIFQYTRHGFADNDNLTFISYAGGACGFAVRYLLLLSPGTDGLDVDADISTHGAAHTMLSRCGIGHMHNGRFKPLCLNDVPDRMGVPSVTCWDMSPSNRLIEYCRHLINCACTWDQIPSTEWREFGHWVWVDHLPPKMARIIFPNAKLMAIQRNDYDTYRDFTVKYMLEPVQSAIVKDGVDPSISNLDLLVSRMADISRESYGITINQQLQWLKKMQAIIRSDATEMGTHIINIDRLLDPMHWRDEYDQMVDYVGLEPNYDKAEEFLMMYREKQYDRETWRPNPDWNWVRLGPNIDGRW